MGLKLNTIAFLEWSRGAQAGHVLDAPAFRADRYQVRSWSGASDTQAVRREVERDGLDTRVVVGERVGARSEQTE